VAVWNTLAAWSKDNSHNHNFSKMGGGMGHSRQGRVAQMVLPLAFCILAGGALGAEVSSPATGTTGRVESPAIPAMEFVPVPGGCYQMGTEKGEKHERPVHKVCLTDFEIGKFEVTQAQWKALMGGNPSNFVGCGDNCPVDQVSWNDTQAFIQKLNTSTGRRHRLPSEAEWEYACRSGGKQDQYPSNEVDKIAWGQENSNQTTHGVGLKMPNDFGIHDMNGNVWEWVQDAFTTPYTTDAVQNNPVINQGEHRVLRGGSWNGKANYVRCSIRNRTPTDRRYFTIGFRIVRELERK
jgi:formylglycine-generating enzyme required for sulfatase activity